jgi:hypothetical protein
VNAIPDNDTASSTGAPRAGNMTLQVDDQGRFDFAGPVGARYRFQIQYTPRPAVLLDSPIGVVGGTPVRLQAGPGLSVSGTVRDRDGRALPGASLNVHSSDWSFSRQAQTGADGRFEVAGLAAGACHLEVSAPGMAAAQLDAEAGATDVAIVLQPSVVTSGIAYDKDGRPASGVQVMLQSKEREGSAYWASTGDDGRFSFGDMPEGEYLLQISREGWEEWRDRGTVVAGRNDVRIDVESE